MSRCPRLLKAIIGIDVSLTGTGLCRFDGTHMRPLAGQVILPPEGVRGWSRNEKICQRVFDYMEDLLPHETAVVIEGYSFGQKGQAHRLARAELTGAIIHPLLRWGCNVYTVPPTSMKLEIAGKGNAEKEEVQAAVYRMYNVWYADLNISDAAGLCVYGYRALVENKPLTLEHLQFELS